MSIELATKVGASIGEPERARHVAVVREPTTAATLRTKGRLFVLVHVEDQGAHGRAIAVAAAEALRDEYYYALSAGIDISLRRAISAANRHARAKLRLGESLHLACAVLCRNEVYAAKVGLAEIFLVRRARLFVPGASKGELTDYAYRATRSTSAPLGVDSEVSVNVWREQTEPGDIVILSVTRLAEVLGAEELKNAVLTLPPAAAATELHDRFAATSGRNAPGILIVEVAPRAAAARVRPPVVAVEDPEVERIAERMRRGVDAVEERGRGLGRMWRSAFASISHRAVGAVAVVMALAPRGRATLPRAADVSAVRALRRRRVTIALAALLVLASTGIGFLAYADFQEARASGNVALSLLRAKQEFDVANAAAAKQPPDVSGAREHLEVAERFLNDAAASRRADAASVATLRGDIARLRTQLTTIVLDLATLDAKTAPSLMDYGQKDVAFIADPGAAKVWRIPTAQPQATATLTQAGAPEGVGVPAIVSLSGDVVYVMDRDGRLFRYDGDRKRELLIKDRKFQRPVDVAVFSQNIYVLDGASGQVWKYEPSADGQYSSPAIAFLEKPLAPDTVRSIAVDGDVWVVTTDGRLHRFHRQTGQTASELDIAIRWRGEVAHVDAVQAKEGQGRKLWILDAAARRVVGIARDGLEEARIALPAELPDASGFVVVEESGYIVTLHGTRLARTDLPR